MAQWPPPPDLESINEIVATVDVEGYLAEGAPGDEYEIEAEEIHEAISTWSIEELTADRLEPVLADIWQGAFEYNDAQLAERKPKLRALAEEIAKFFGPEAKPQVRGA
ncbi:hypothetical protein [Granulicella cerasi]|uniref:hypothetical protein n=1 Tax=Granulicella cerasi TaxID=741063 RepID=UPI0021E0CD20|nr:hypothetical protein [Granulicella cerasi]